MNKGQVIQAILFCLVLTSGSAQVLRPEIEPVIVGPRLSLGLEAGAVAMLPVGERSTAYDATAFGGQLSTLISPNVFPVLAPRIDISYAWVPVPELESTAMTLVAGLAGVQLTGSIGERLRPSAHALGGGYFGQVTGEAEGNDFYLAYDIGVGAAFQLLDSFSMGIEASYRSYVGLYDGVTIGLQWNLRVGGPGGGAVPLQKVTPLVGPAGPASGLIDFVQVELEPVFPVLWKFYDTSPVGSATLTNVGSDPLTNVEVRVSPAAYIDRPKVSARVDRLEPGETTSVDLYVLFNESILSVSEGAKIVTDITVSYRADGATGSDTETLTLDAYDRNALRWDDDARIAAFVTAKDEEVNRFTRSIAGIAGEINADAVSRNMRLGMIALEAMAEQRLAYVIDPTSAYAALSQNPGAIDFVQFPRQTLYVGGGDCDDLSSTYNALLESLGISTAFITTPGHIFAAFRLNMSPETARTAFADADEIIVRDDGSVWVPVETTLLGEGFVRAWSTGARQWRTASAAGVAAFIPTATAWERYQPVAFSVSEIDLELPNYESVQARFTTEFDRFTSRELAPRVDRLSARLESNPDDQRTLNRLGVLYAMFGRYDEARAQFERATAVSTSAPALVNLGNLEFLQGNISSALERYQAALVASPENRTALLGVARSQYELGNAANAREAHIELARVAPEVAAEYSYLASGASTSERASGGGAEPFDLLWAEE